MKGGGRPNHNLASGVLGRRWPVAAYSLRASSSQRFTAAWRTPDLSDPEVATDGARYRDQQRASCGRGRRAAGATSQPAQQAKQRGGRAIRDDFHAMVVSAESGRTQGTNEGTQVPTRAGSGGRGTKGGRGRAWQGMTKKCRREGIYGVMVTPSKGRQSGLVTRDETPFRN